MNRREEESRGVALPDRRATRACVPTRPGACQPNHEAVEVDAAAEVGPRDASTLIHVSGRHRSGRLQPYGHVLLPVVMSLLVVACATVRIVEPRAEASCANTGAGALIVRVVDTSGLSLPGVAVSLSKGSGLGAQRLTSDGKGVIAFRDLSPLGTCDLRAEHPGLETTIARHVSCAAGCETRLELVMRVDMRHAVTITERLPGGRRLKDAPESPEMLAKE